MDGTLEAVMGVGAGVWIATELVGRALSKVPYFQKLTKDQLAVAFGLVLGFAAQGSGQVAFGDGAWGWVNAGLLGLVSTAAAAYGHQMVMKPTATALKAPTVPPRLPK